MATDAPTPARTRPVADRAAARAAVARVREWVLSPAGLVTLIVTVGVALRLYRFTAPILDQHAFRQTQTASTVWLWDRFGFDLLDYRVPMFGAGNWVLELPVYQALVWALEQPFDGGIEPAGRLVSIASYVAVCALTYLIAVRLLGSRTAAVLSVAVFTFLPVTVFYYRAVMIDPMLIAVTLLVVYAMLRLVERFSWGWFAVLAPALVVAVLGKATLMLALGLPAVVLGVRLLLDRAAPLAGKAALVGLAAGTLVLSALWTRHGDELNLASGALTYSNGSDWFFGTTFTDPELVRTVGQRFLDNLGPIGLILVGIGIAAVPALRTGRRLEVAAMLLGGAVSIGVFANLNRIHDYYQLPYYTTLAMMAGLGLSVLVGVLARVSPTASRQVAAGVVIALAATWSIATWTTYFAPAAVNLGLRGQALEMRAATPDQRLLVIQEGGDKNDPILWYEARRVGWRVPTSDEGRAAQIVRDAGDLGAVVFLRGPAPEPPWVAELAARRGFARTFEGPSLVVYSAPA